MRSRTKRASADVADSFEVEVFFNLRRQRTVFGIIALCSTIVAAGCVGALLLVLPLREVRPYVVTVDELTGQSQLIVQTRPTDLAGEDAIREAELVRYVTDRETYDAHDNARRIPDVLIRSTGQAATSLRGLWNTNNPDYPPDLYGREALITVRITSISQLDPNTAQVRFTRRLEEPGARPVERDFVATVGFQFNPRVERRLELVWRNPLGFQVTGYRVDAETLQPRQQEEAS